MKKNKKKKLAVIALFAMLAIVSATFAWLTASDSAKNHFSTKQISGDAVEVTEKFDPPTNWKPGQTVTKEAKITNKSTDTTMVARVHFTEVLQKLNLSAAGDLDVKPEKDPTAASVANYIPKHVNIGVYAGAEWDSVAGTDLASTSEINSTKMTDYKLIVKVKTVGLTDTFVMYRTLDDGNFQAVDSGTTHRDASGKVVLEGVRFQFYSGRGNDAYDWTVGKPNSATPPVVEIPKTADMIDFTTPAAPVANILTDTAGPIKINLDNVTAAPTQNKWFYNEEDGYFYYIGTIVPAGTTVPAGFPKAGESAALLKSVTMLGSADEKYGALDFDLTVHVNAIQNYKAAMNAADGWNLNITTGNAKLIYDKLVADGALVDQ